MLPRTFKPLLVAMVVVLLGGAMSLPVHAQQGHEIALRTGQWTSSDCARTQWFRFSVGHHENQELSYVSIVLTNNVNGTPLFHVFAGEAWSYWGTPQEGDWMGTSGEVTAGSTAWSGQLEPGAYYVEAEPGGGTVCTFSASGEAVVESFFLNLQPTEFVYVPAEASVQQAPVKEALVEEAPTLLASTPAAVEPVASHHEGDMAMLPGEWMPVTDNEPHWMTFYVGPVDGSPTSHVTVDMVTMPEATGRFQVFLPEKSSPWGEPEQDSWFGASYSGSGGEVTWSGDLVPGAYYLRIVPEGHHECLVAVSGEAVTY
jgi:hypothetical protein